MPGARSRAPCLPLSSRACTPIVSGERGRRVRKTHGARGAAFRSLLVSVSVGGRTELPLRLHTSSSRTDWSSHAFVVDRSMCLSFFSPGRVVERRNSHSSFCHLEGSTERLNRDRQTHRFSYPDLQREQNCSTRMTDERRRQGKKRRQRKRTGPQRLATHSFSSFSGGGGVQLRHVTTETAASDCALSGLHTTVNKPLCRTPEQMMARLVHSWGHCGSRHRHGPLDDSADSASSVEEPSRRPLAVPAPLRPSPEEWSAPMTPLPSGTCRTWSSGSRRRSSPAGLEKKSPEPEQTNISPKSPPPAPAPFILL